MFVPRILNIRGHEVHVPTRGELGRFRATFRNWPTVLAARMNLVQVPVTGRWRDGSGTVRVTELGLAALYAAGGRPSGPADVTFEFGGRTVTLRGFARYGDPGGVFIDQDWAWLPVAGRTVVDVGASVGDSATYFALRGAKKVLAYELNPPVLELLRQNVALNGLASVEARPAVRNLADAAEGAPEGDLVAKVDCEGCEYALLDETTDAALQRYSHLMLEYHYGPGSLRQRLEKAGFRVRSTRPRVPSGPLGKPAPGRPAMSIGFLWAERA